VDELTVAGHRRLHGEPLNAIWIWLSAAQAAGSSRYDGVVDRQRGRAPTSQEHDPMLAIVVSLLSFSLG
jgi:hypothetical protein